MHEHLFEDHRSELTLSIIDTDTGNAVQFTLNCPECAEEQFSEHITRPQADAARLVESYEEELTMIAFDQLLYHLSEIRAN